MKIAVLGVNTLLGQELVNSFSDHFFSIEQLRVFDYNAVGQSVFFGETEIFIEKLTEHILLEGEFSLVFVTDKIDENLLLVALSKGMKVIDVTSSYQEGVCIVPEINSDVVEKHSFLVNPNSQTVQLALALAPIRQYAKIKRVVVSVYQAVSEEGMLGVDELERQILEIENGKETTLHCFPKQIAFNVIPVVDRLLDNGWTELEKQVEKDMRCILNDSDLEVLVTCVQVPVLRGNGMSVMLETDTNLSLDTILQSWESVPYLQYFYQDEAPTPWGLEGTIGVGLGRLRKDPYKSGIFHFWVVADNILRSRVHNSIGIAQQLITK